VDIKEYNRNVVKQFRAGGAIEGLHRERLVLLTTVGRRSGRRITTPMMFHRDGDRLLVMASDAGSPRIPDWYRNLVADPHVAVEIGDECYRALAVPAEGAERERLWAIVIADYPFFADHQVKAGRIIPVVVLTRARESA
jgi:deazaflavin-dependent oxidoreductase (nitroreductase family)